MEIVHSGFTPKIAMLGLFICLWDTKGALAIQIEKVQVKINGTETKIFDYQSQRCDTENIPDAPARIFKNAQGELKIFAADTGNRALRRTSEGQWVSECDITIKSKKSEKPEEYADSSWIAALWTDDGNDIAGLIHHEYQAYRHPGRCKFKQYEPCWYNTITSAKSLDGGLSFIQSNPPIVVAAIPFTQDVDQGRRRGFFSPSNIIFDGENWTVFLFTTGWAGQPSGSCIFRTNNVKDPSSWLAYDGKGFNSTFPDPYRNSLTELGKRCQTVHERSFGSVVKIRNSNTYLASIIRRRDDGVHYVAVLVSRNLLNWSDPIDLLKVDVVGDTTCRSKFAFPSIVDFTAPGRNFDTVGDSATLLITKFNLHNCKDGLDRDLVAYPLSITVN